MNERIRELAFECARQLNWTPPSDPKEYTFSSAGLEKFAELIVRECFQTLVDNTPERFTNESAEEDWDKGYDRAMKDCVRYIKENFGVKE